MLIPSLLVGLTLLLWGLWAGNRASLMAMALAVVVVGYICGYDAWRLEAGPGTITLDRLAILGVTLLAGWRAWRGRIQATQPTGADWALLLTIGWLGFSCFLNPRPEGLIDAPSQTNRLLLSFGLPALLFALMRHERFDASKARWLLTTLACVGLYLALTAVMETAGVWSLVFPRYIADPELGLHYGRARGPALNSVSLGVYLGIATVATLLLIPRSSRLMQLFWSAAAGLMTFSVLLTYTRSTWIGLALAGTFTVCMQLPRRVRKPVCVLALATLAVVGYSAKKAIVSLEREDSANVSAHSVQQRLAFAYVSYQMFRDHPLMGVGFGRFVDKKLPYLSDRRQWFELESIRQLEHHNTYLGLLTETGMLGLFAYLALLGSIGAAGWRLYNLEGEGQAVRSIGLLAIGTLFVYASSALFHDLTLVHSDQWLLFAIGGAAIGALVNSPAMALARAQAEPNRELIVSPPLPNHGMTTS